MEELTVVVLAAGQGTRMRSRRPKVLHPLADRPLLAHVLDTAERLQPQRLAVVYGHGGDQVREAFADRPGITWVHQAEQLGTGHAVAQALASLEPKGTVLVLYGDVPLLREETLRELLAARAEAELVLLTARIDDPRGYGRILRDEAGRVQGIVEEKDASEAQRLIDEVNTGVLAAGAEALARWVNALERSNAQGEYYLTDVVALAVAEGLAVATRHPREADEFLGVNDRVQLAHLERRYQRRQAQDLMQLGVTLRDPARLDVRGRVEAGRDVVIDVDVILEGEVVLGDGVEIGPFCHLKDVRLGPGCKVLSHSVLEGVEAGEEVSIGPFARLRPGTNLAARAKVGNFVEIKNAQVGEGSKINHLSYVGDAEVGREVNIGAGTITCNYDGANKHRTIIEDRAFIGSDSQLVAPVRIGEGATIGAGSTITRDAPPHALTLSRVPQKTREGWQRPVKRKKGGS